jgi:Xaa-Pro aminopeptidase
MNLKLTALREEMQFRELTAYIVPTADPHMSEYLAPRWQSRKWLTGFTGSAGTAVITEEKAGLWADGRYYIQAGSELKGSGVDLFKLYTPGVPDHITWLIDTLKKGDRIGIDGSILSAASYKDMKKRFDKAGLELVTEFDLIDPIWNDRPELPKKEVFAHDVQFAGKSRIEKIADLRKDMKKKKADHYIVSALDEIAWLFNIRGSDIDFNPVTIAYVVISLEETLLFISKEKVPQNLLQEFMKDDIQIRGYVGIGEFLKQILENEKVCYPPKSTNQWLVGQINEKAVNVECKNLISLPKSRKNQVEIENLKSCLQRDCVALVKFLYWLDNNLGSIKMTEISAAEKLAELRSKQKNFMGLSFPAISAYGSNAAMMHYSPKPGADVVLDQEGFYLIDSGGQYLDGTTDITRTVSLGALSEEEKRHFTLVLKSMIALTQARFLKGSTGANLDILARQPMWEAGLDYKCGTGHGVGFFLNVHEGPQNFSQAMVNVPFEIGMVTTNEPGIYREGEYGIRTENMLLTVPDQTTDSGEFLKFETLSFCPIDLKAIESEMLNRKEKEWLNNYHAQVFEKLANDLDPEERKWLKETTKPVL